MEKESRRTQENVQAALSDTLLRASLYRLYSRSAREEGYVQIADLFLQTADQVLEHAALLWTLSTDCRMPDTAENLRDAAARESRGEYARFASEAESQGMPETAALFHALSGVEKNHARRFRILSENLRTGAVFQKTQDVYWLCRVCGALSYGKSAPRTCPVCGYPQACFSVYAEDY